MDHLTIKGRSALMSRIRGYDNSTTEARLAFLLRKHRLAGWRRSSVLTGRPDFVWVKERVAVFVDGCFWHGCPRHGHVPKSRLEYWQPKLERNRRRDRSASRILRSQGWKVIRIWECALRQNRETVPLRRLAKLLGKDSACPRRQKRSLRNDR